MKRRGFLGACIAAVISPYIPTAVAMHEEATLKVTEDIFKIGDIFTISGVKGEYGGLMQFKITNIREDKVIMSPISRIYL